MRNGYVFPQRLIESSSRELFIDPHIRVLLAPHRPAVADQQKLGWNLVALNLLVAANPSVADHGTLAALAALDESEKKQLVGVDPHLVGCRVAGFRSDD